MHTPLRLARALRLRVMCEHGLSRPRRPRLLYCYLVVYLIGCSTAFLERCHTAGVLLRGGHQKYQKAGGGRARLGQKRLSGTLLTPGLTTMVRGIHGTRGVQPLRRRLNATRSLAFAAMMQTITPHSTGLFLRRSITTPPGGRDAQTVTSLDPRVKF
jgi:hypothetical protein